jgi:hypothetical protein
MINLEFLVRGFNRFRLEYYNMRIQRSKKVLNRSQLYTYRHSMAKINMEKYRDKYLSLYEKL